jgi:autotransporter-associated beta strand protein
LSVEYALLDIDAGGYFTIVTNAAGQTTMVGALNGAGNIIRNAQANIALLAFGDGDANGNFTGVIDEDIFSGGPGAISLKKIGAGTQVLAGTSNHSGTTTVSAGTLLLNAIHAGGALYTVDGGATLGGNGSTDSAVLFSSGATGSPGNSVGLQTTGSQTWQNLDTYIWEVAQAGTAGLDYDSYVVNGLLDFDSVPAGGIALQIIGLGGSVTNSDTFALWTYNTLDGWDTGTGIGNPSNLFDFSISGNLKGSPIVFDDGEGTIWLTGISSTPEPSTAVLALCSIVCCGTLRRCRRRA